MLRKGQRTALGNEANFSTDSDSDSGSKSLQSDYTDEDMDSSPEFDGRGDLRKLDSDYLQGRRKEPETHVLYGPTALQPGGARYPPAAGSGR